MTYLVKRLNIDKSGCDCNGWDEIVHNPQDAEELAHKWNDKNFDRVPNTKRYVEVYIQIASMRPGQSDKIR